MSSAGSEFRPGLEGVVAFQTEIAEPDRDGGALRYRGVDIEDLVGVVPFDDVWSLLVDGEFGSAPQAAGTDPLPLRTGDVRADVQAALAAAGPAEGMPPLLDVEDVTARDQLSRCTGLALSYAAESARGDLAAVPREQIEQADSAAEQFLVRWRGEADPAHVRALDAYWVSAAEHGLNASTFTSRVIASTGADAAACLSGAVGAMSGPLHGGAPARVLPMIEEAERTGNARQVVESVLDRGDRLMGFGHRVYRAEDPRARVLRRTCEQLSAPRFEVARALEGAALDVLRERRPDRQIETNVEFWAAVVLDFAQVPTPMMPAMFTCARLAGWSAHVLEQKRTGRLVRPSAEYIGPGARSPQELSGWQTVSSVVAPA